MSKSEFAASIGVSAARVSQYIKEGKIDSAALVGEGRSARIRVDVARDQLRRSLDLSQMTGNGLKTNLGGSPSPTSRADAPSLLSDRDDEASRFDQRMRLEKLEQAQMQTRKMRAEEQARSGRYVLAADADASMARLAARIVSVFEGGLPDLAASIAERFEVPVRDVTHLLHRDIKELRTRAAQAAQEQLGKVMLLVADESDEGQGG